MYQPEENRFEQLDNEYVRPPRRQASPMATAALTFAVLGIISSLTGFFSIIFGSLAILFSALSKGNRPRPEKAAKFACRLGILSIAISIVVICVSVKIVLTQYGGLENYYNTYLYTIEQNYGITLDDFEAL